MNASLVDVQSLLDTVTFIAVSNVALSAHAFVVNLFILVASWRLRKRNLNFLIAAVAAADFGISIGEGGLGVLSFFQSQSGRRMSKGSCLDGGSLAIFSINLSTACMLCLGVDRFLAIRFAERYETWRLGRYRAAVLCPAVVAAGTGLALAHLSKDYAPGLYGCFAASALAGAGLAYFVLGNNCIIILCAAVYGAIYRLIKNKIRDCSSCTASSVVQSCQCGRNRVVLSTLGLILLANVFWRTMAFSWIFLSLNVWTGDTMEVRSNFADLPGLLSCGTNFYILLRSSEYRAQFRLLFGRAEVGVVTVTRVQELND